MPSRELNGKKWFDVADLIDWDLRLCLVWLEFLFAIYRLRIGHNDENARLIYKRIELKGLEGTDMVSFWTW